MALSLQILRSTSSLLTQPRTCRHLRRRLRSCAVGTVLPFPWSLPQEQDQRFRGCSEAVLISTVSKQAIRMPLISSLSTQAANSLTPCGIALLLPPHLLLLA